MRRSADVLADELDAHLEAATASFRGATLGISVYDYLSGCEWNFNGDRWFHAASVIKVPVMVALFEAIDQGA